MTPEQLQRELAEALGWKQVASNSFLNADGWASPCWQAPDGKLHIKLPDYPHDLNAAVEAIRGAFFQWERRWDEDSLGRVWVFDDRISKHADETDGQTALALATALLAAIKARKEAGHGS